MTASTSSAVSDPASTVHRLEHFPIALFSIIMGTTGLALVWLKAHAVLGLSVMVGEAVRGAASALFIILLLIYFMKTLRYPQAVRNELRHPIRVNFFPTVSISLLLLSIAQTTPAHLRGAPPPRARTTPRATPRATPALHPMGAQDGTGRSLDSMAAGLALLPVDDGSPASICAAAVDVDVSGPPHITLSDLPPVPVTPAPAQGQAVGFGMENDKLELRFELEQSQKNRF